MANRARDDQARRDGIEFDAVSQSDKDPNIAKYLVGRQRERDQGIWLEDPVVMATTADPPEPVDGVQLLDDGQSLDRGGDEEKRVAPDSSVDSGPGTPSE